MGVGYSAQPCPCLVGRSVGERVWRAGGLGRWGGPLLTGGEGLNPTNAVRVAVGASGESAMSCLVRLAAGPDLVDGLRGRPHVATRTQRLGPLCGEFGRAHVVKRQNVSVAVKPFPSSG